MKDVLLESDRKKIAKWLEEIDALNADTALIDKRMEVLSLELQDLNLRKNENNARVKEIEESVEVRVCFFCCLNLRLIS